MKALPGWLGVMFLKETQAGAFRECFKGIKGLFISGDFYQDFVSCRFLPISNSRMLFPVLRGNISSHVIAYYSSGAYKD